MSSNANENEMNDTSGSSLEAWELVQSALDALEDTGQPSTSAARSHESHSSTDAEHFEADANSLACKTEAETAAVEQMLQLGCSKLSANHIRLMETLDGCVVHEVGNHDSLAVISVDAFSPAHRVLAAWGERATVTASVILSHNCMDRVPGATLTNSFRASANECYGIVCAYAPLPFETLAAGGGAPVCAAAARVLGPVDYASMGTALVHTVRAITTPSATTAPATHALPLGAYIVTLTVTLLGQWGGVEIEIPLTRA